MHVVGEMAVKAAAGEVAAVVDGACSMTRDGLWRGMSVAMRGGTVDGNRFVDHGRWSGVRRRW